MAAYLRNCSHAAALMIYCAAGLQAQQPGSAELSHVEGRVANALTGQPVAEAAVTLYRSVGGDAASEITSDAAGRFMIDGIAPGTYRIAAEGKGYLQPEYSATEALVIAPGQTIKDLELKLTPQGEISGRVLADPDRPLAGVEVVALRSLQAGNTRRMTRAAETRTDALGEFHLTDLSPGNYLLAANRPGASALPDSGFIATFYPSAPDANGAVPVRLTAGQDASRSDIQMLKEPLQRVSGKVLGRSAGLEVMLLPQGSGLVGGFELTVTKPTPDGTFNITGVRAGSYSLVLRQTGMARMIASVPLEVGSRDILDAEITAGDLLSLSGAFRMDEGHERLQGATVQLARLSTNGDGPSISANNDGSFHMENIAPELYGLNFGRLPKGSYVRAARWGGQDVLTNGLDLTHGPASGNLDIAVSNKGAVVEGRVALSESAAPASPGQNTSPVQDTLLGIYMVALLPDPPRPLMPYLYRRLQTDSIGRFQTQGVPPGTYRMYAVEEGEGVLTLEFMDAAASRGVKVTLSESQHEQIEVPLIKLDGSDAK